MNIIYKNYFPPRTQGLEDLAKIINIKMAIKSKTCTYRKGPKNIKKIQLFLDPSRLCYTALPFEAIESLSIIILTKQQ